MVGAYLPRLIGRAVTYVGTWFICVASFSFAGELHTGPGLQVQLVIDQETVPPGASFHAGLYFRLDKGWHIYWQNAGDSGEPPTITWDLPPDVQAGPILWPVPKRIEVEPFVNYGYEEEVLLPIPMQLATTFSGPHLVLAADVHWLVCKLECIPGRANLTLPVPIRLGYPRPDPHWSTLFEATLGMLPRQPPPHWRLSGSLDPDSFHLAVHGVTGPIKTASFLPLEGDYLEHAAAQQVNTSVSSVKLQLQRSSRLLDEVTHLAGVLVLTTEADGIQFYQVEFPLGGLDAHHLVWPLSLAFVGGLLLNIMPCVFPVLSLKVMSLLHMSGEPRSRIISLGWAYTLGILVSFWILVAVLLILQYAGQQIGW